MTHLDEEVLTLRKWGGFCLLDHFGIIELSGADSRPFLQARLSNDLNALKPGQGQLTSLLDRKAHVVALFVLLQLEDTRYWLLMESDQIPTVLQQLDAYHFAEKVEYSRRDDLRLWTVQGPQTDRLFSAIAASKSRPVREYDTVAQDGFTAIRRSLAGDTGFVFAFARNDDKRKLDLETEARALHMVPLSPEALAVSRVEAGILQYGIDVTDEQLLPETGLEHEAASYSKGCFQGQEVLARIRTFGAPRRGLVGLTFDAASTATFPLNTSCRIDGTEVGTIKSNVWSPTFKRTVALAYVLREHRVPDAMLSLSIGDVEFHVKVTPLPFYNTEVRKENARAIYQKGLSEFATGSEQQAVELLKEAIALDPVFADAYESLGVVLSRHNRLDEAIALMKTLAELDPDSIMAHANLSVFYMQQGNKEAAEEEKAQAMSIRMSKLAREMAQAKEQESERQQKREDAQQRLEMFKQVLEIDAEDLLANAGLGGVYVDLEQYENAVPYLKKALEIKPQHTVAYLALAQAYENLKLVPEAIDIYKAGIAVAAQRGDLAPMKDMQARLAVLGTAAGS